MAVREARMAPFRLLLIAEDYMVLITGASQKTPSKSARNFQKNERIATKEKQHFCLIDFV